MGLSTLFFYYFAVVAVVTGILTVSRANPVHSLAFFIPCLIHIAGLFLILGAEFLAGVQVLIYTGAIVVLYLFVVALLNLSAIRGHRITNRQRFLAGAVVALLTVQVTTLVVLSGSAGQPAPAGGEAFGGNTQAVGSALYTTFLFPFELASLVLLVAVFGAVVLTRRSRETREETPSGEQGGRP